MISALEAFQYAEQKTTKFYETNKRLATEHAVLEDTGKGEGVKLSSRKMAKACCRPVRGAPRLRAAIAIRGRRSWLPRRKRSSSRSMS